MVGGEVAAVGGAALVGVFAVSTVDGAAVHRVATFGAPDDVEEGGAGTAGFVAFAAGTLALDGGVGGVVPDGREAVGGGGGAVPGDQAGVGVVVEDADDGGKAPAFGLGGRVGGVVHLAGDLEIGDSLEEEFGDEADGGGVLVELGADRASGGVVDGGVAGGPGAGVEAALDAVAHSAIVVLDAAALVFASAGGLDGKDVAVTGAFTADDVGVGGQVDLRTAFFDEGEYLVGEGGIAAQAVGVDGVEDVEGAVQDVEAELFVGGHCAFGVLPEDDVTGVAGDGVDADDCAIDGGGELAAGFLLGVEGDFVFGGLVFAGDGAPDGDADGRMVGWSDIRVIDHCSGYADYGNRYR